MDDRELSRAVRGLADDDSARLASVPVSPTFFATVSSTSPLTVTWRGADVLAAGKGMGYTPAVGQRVECVLVRNQLIVRNAIDGQP